MKTLEADSLLKGAVSVSNQLSEDDTNEKHPKLNAEDSNADVLPCQNGSDDCMKLNTCHVLLHRLPTTSDTVDDSVPIDARSTSDGMASQSERIDVEAALSQHSLPKRAANSSENGLESELISTTPYLYKCSLCDKVMSRRAHIVRHFRIHTGERPYQCDTCEKAFTDRSNFQRHKVRCRGTSTMGENALGWAAVSQCYKIIQGNGTEVTEPDQHLDNLKGDTTSTPGSASDGQSWCFVDSSFGQSLLDTSAEHSADENSARIAQIYGAGRQHKCFYCNAIMASPSEMKRHVRVHTGEKPYQCSGCDAAFARSYDLYRHERRRHHIVHSWWNQTKQTGNSTHIVANEQVLAASSNVQEYTHRIVEDVEAKSESQVFPSGGEPAGSMGHTDLDNSNTIDVDRQQIRGQQFVCFYCNLEVSSAAQLKIHTRVHTGEKPYPCNLCESSFARSYDLKRHKRLRHKIFMPLTNTAKEKRSKKKHTGSPDDILNHTAGAKVPASDPHDETEGHSEEYIRVNGVKQECCVDDAFGQSSQPFVDNDSRSYTPGAKRSGKEKRYKCFYCDMMATCPSQLAIHMRVHTGEKPYQCNLCDTAFARSYDLYRHKRIRHKVFFSWTGKIRNRSVKQSTMLQLRGAHQISRPKFSAVTRQNVAEIAEVLEDTVGLTGMKLECSGDDDDDIFNHGAREQNADRRIKNRRSHGLQSYIRKRRYKCFYCNTLVSSPSQLTIHTRVHTGEKPYRCNLCDTAFARSYDLHRHKRNSHEFSRSLPSASVGIKRRRSTTKRSSMLLLEGENLPLEAQVLTSDQGNVADVVADLSETSIGFIETKPEGYGGDNAFDQGSCDQTINLQTERLTPGLKKSYIRTRRYKCFHCNTPMSSPSQLTIHLRVHTGEKPYQCTQCDTAFARSYDLRRHLRNSHNVSVSWNIRQNRRRSTNHSRDFQLENPSSQRKLTLPASTQQPIAEVEDISEDTVGFNVAITESLNEKTCYQGPTLDQVIDLQDIGLQKKSHTRAVKKYIRKRRYKCFYCEKTVTCPSQLTIHLRVHTGEKPYQCTHCDTAFARSFDLYRHMRNSHSLPVSWTSIKRSRNVKRSDVLQLSSAHLLPEVEVAAADQHLTNVEEILSSVGFNEVNVKRRDGDGSFHQDPGEQTVDLLKKKSVRGVKKYIRKRRYKCFYCEKTVTCPSQLTIHLRVHTGEKPYQCTHCDAAFARSFDLYRHMRNSHSLPVSWTSIKRSRNVKRSPLLQLLEGEDLSSEAIALTSDQKLVAEMEDVSEDTVGFSETTFKCTDGDVVFDTGSFQQNFDRPKKKRSNSVQGFTRENMYKCFYCEKTVSCPSQLAIHLRVHTGEKPYQCELCDLPFARSSDLSRHERNSHKLFLPRTSKKRSKSTDEQIQVLQLENASLSSGEMLSASNQQHVEDVEDVSIDCHTELRVVGDQRPSVQQNVVRKRKPVRNAKPYVRQRRYECPFCNRMMTSPSELTRHTRIHTGEKPYPCNQCEAAFARAHDLFRHRRSCHKLPVKKSKSANNPVS